MQRNPSHLAHIASRFRPESLPPNALPSAATAALRAFFRVSSRREFGRSLSVNNRARHRDIGKLLSINRAAQHQSTATHIAATDEVSGEAQPVTKFGQQNVNIFSRGNAAEQNDFAPGLYFLYQTPRVALERFSITRITFVNVDQSEFTQVVETNSRVRIDQATRWRDNKSARGLLGSDAQMHLRRQFFHENRGRSEK